jgi:hypothetical protein
LNHFRERLIQLCAAVGVELAALAAAMVLADAPAHAELHQTAQDGVEGWSVIAVMQAAAARPQMDQRGRRDCFALSG